MPLNPGSSRDVISGNIREFHTGKTYAHTAAKFGKETANRQAIAVALSTARKSRAAGGAVHRDMGGGVDDMLMGGGGGFGGVGGQQFIPNAPGIGMGVADPYAGAGAQSAMGQNPPQPGMLGQVPQNSGMPQDQGVSHPMDRPLMNAGGGVLHRDIGGFTMQKHPHLTGSFESRQAERGLMRGPVISTVPGRTDLHRGKVASGSYVLPADLISGRGQGNTLAGMKFWNNIFHSAPYGGPAGKVKFGSGAPRPPKPFMHAGGGKGGNHVGKPTDVVVAGGEIIIEPDDLMRGLAKLGHSPRDLEHAHRLMDALVLHERKRLIKQLKRLPGPAKD